MDKQIITDLMELMQDIGKLKGKIEVLEEENRYLKNLLNDKLIK